MKIVFVHAGLKSYRNKLFSELSNKLGIHFLLYGGKTVYKSKPEWEQESRKWTFEILPAIKTKLYSFIAIKSYKALKYDIIISSDPSSFSTHFLFPLSKILNKKFILWGETWIWPENILGKISLPYVKLIIRKSDAIIAAGNKSKEWFIEQGASASKVFVAPNSAENLETPKKPDKLFQDQLKNKQTILYLGRIVPYKGLDSLIDAYASVEKKYPNSFLLIAGPGEEKFLKICKQKAKEKLKNYKFIGAVKHQKINKYISGASFFVLPAKFIPGNKVPGEAWGLTINEVMSLGKPVISTTAVAAAHDLVENNVTGYLVPENNTIKLTHALDKLLENPIKTKKMGLKAKRKVTKEYNYLKQAKGFEDAIKYTLQ